MKSIVQMWESWLERHRNDRWVEIAPDLRRGYPLWYPSRTVFAVLERIRGGNIGVVHVSSADAWLVLLINGPRIQRFSKRHGECYSPRRWGGAILGLEIGQR